MTDEVQTTERDLRHYAEKMLCGGGNSVTWQRCQAVARAYLATRADTGGERERSCEVCSENMAMCQMLRPDDDRKMCLTCFLERTEGGTDTPAATQPTLGDEVMKAATDFLNDLRDTDGPDQHGNQCNYCDQQAVGYDQDNSAWVCAEHYRARHSKTAPAAPQPTPAGREEDRCPRCEGSKVYNFGPCSLCNGTGLMTEAVKHSQPTPASQEGERSPFCMMGQHERCEWKGPSRCHCQCHGATQPTPAAGDAEYALIEAEPWRQGYVGTFPELCSAYGRACSAISAFEDDASLPLDEHIATLVKRLAVAEAALKTMIEDSVSTDTVIRDDARRVLDKALVDGDSEFVPAIEDIVEQLVGKIIGRRAVPAEVAEAAQVIEAARQREINLNRVLTLDVMKERPAAFTLARYVRTLAAGEAAEHE